MYRRHSDEMFCLEGWNVRVSSDRRLDFFVVIHPDDDASPGIF